MRDGGSAPLFVRRIETIAAITGLSLLAIGCVMVLRPFFTALLWAMVLTYSTWPVYAWLEGKLRHRTWLAALLMTLLLALAFILPLAFLAATMADAVTAFADSLRRLLEQGPPLPPLWVRELPGIGPELDDAWRELAGNTAEFAAFMRPYLLNARGWAIGAGLTLGAAILELSLSVLAAFFFYRDGMRVIERVRAIGHRILGDRVHQLLQVTSATLRAVVYGTIGGAVAQGIVAALGFYIAGVPGAMFLASATFLFGLVPGGPPLIWISVTIWLASTDQLGGAAFMALWGFFGISGVDNLIKPYLISRGSSLPILLVILGVFGGAAAFGFIGLFLGPTLLGVAYALILDWSALAQPRTRPAERERAPAPN